MADTTIRNAILNLFQIKDLNNDGHYSENVAGEVTQLKLDFYTYLDSLDNKLGNGFNDQNLNSIFRNNNLEILQNYYPLLKFKFNPEKDTKIKVYPNLPVFMDYAPLSSAQPLFDQVNLKVENFDVGLRVVQSHFNPNPEGIHIKFADLHHLPNHSIQFYNAVTTIVNQRDQTIVFFEQCGGISQYDDQAVDWALALFLNRFIKMTSSQNGAVPIQNLKAEGDPLKINDYRNAFLSLTSYGTAPASEYENRIRDKIGSKEKFINEFTNNPIFREAIISINPAFALKLMLGEKVLVINCEYDDKKLTTESLRSPYFMVEDINTFSGEYTKRSDGESNMILPENYSDLELMMKEANIRSRLWAQNIETIINSDDAKIKSYLGEPPLIISFGGENHLPELTNLLGDKYSSITLKPINTISYSR